MKERGQVQGEKENKHSILAICGAGPAGPGNFPPGTGKGLCLPLCKIIKSRRGNKRVRPM